MNIPTLCTEYLPKFKFCLDDKCSKTLASDKAYLKDDTAYFNLDKAYSQTFYLVVYMIDDIILGKTKININVLEASAAFKGVPQSETTEEESKESTPEVKDEKKSLEKTKEVQA